MLEEQNNADPLLNTNTIPINIGEDRENLLLERDRSFWKSSLLKKCLLSIFTSLILVLIVLVVIVSQTKNQIESLKENLRREEASEDEMRRLLDEKDQLIKDFNQLQNQSIEQFNTRLAERSSALDQLNKTHLQFKAERSTNQHQ